MPELPEVETVCRTIAPYVCGRRIEAVRVHEKRLRRRVADDFAERLSGRPIEGVRRRGKYIIFAIGGGEMWAVHLGMSGRLLVGAKAPGARHVHIEVDLEGGRFLHFQDPRRFGASFLLRDEADLGDLGLEPLEDSFDADALWALRKAHPRVTIKSLLMDQRCVVGVGNIYASEALHRAGVRPSRRCKRLLRREAAVIVEAVKEVLHYSIESGGSSLRDYRDAQGNAGAFQNMLRVYDREGEACGRCGAAIRARQMGGRNTFWCSGCQR